MSKINNIELLMSIMHQKDFSLAKLSKVDSNLLIINQCDENKTINSIENGNQWRMISTTERGLSRSRNMALANAQGKICKLCDDDETLADDYVNIIQSAYEEIPEADVIVFNVHRINYKMKKTYYKIPEIRIAPNYRSYQSSMITFRLDKIKEAGIKFNEFFGSGGNYGGGEDTIFIRDIRNAGLKIYEHPAYITTLDYGRFGSNWFKGYNDKYFYNQGVFHEYNNPNHKISNIIWGLYQIYKLRGEKLNPISVIKWRLNGAKGFRNGKLTYEDFLNLNK